MDGFEKREMEELNRGTGFAFPGTAQPTRRSEKVKVIVKQEADTTCAWVVGEDGETEETTYLKGGQQVEIDVEIAAKGDEDGQINYPKATMGEVGPITDSNGHPVEETQEKPEEPASGTAEPVNNRSAQGY